MATGAQQHIPRVAGCKLPHRCCSVGRPAAVLLLHTLLLLQVPLIVAERVFLAVLRKAGITLPNPLRIVLTIACQNQVRVG